jgi:hypothetical protein
MLGVVDVGAALAHRGAPAATPKPKVSLADDQRLDLADVRC